MAMLEQRSGVTPADPKKKQVHDLLRHVDALIRAKDLAKAFLEIQRARSIDERNPYVRAYEERLTELIEEKKKQDKAQEPEQQARTASEERRRESEQTGSPSPMAAGTTAPVPGGTAQPPSPKVQHAPEPARRSHGLMQFRSANKPVQRTPMVVVVDDDKDLLPVLREVVQLNGFECTAFETTDAAYAQLQTGAVPDIIVCDINLETSTMGGFSFYEKVRSDDRFSSVPFIFLSGLSDEAVIRTGKELGADDYLTKPISEEMLIATIKGKLRRFERLQQRLA